MLKLKMMLCVMGCCRWSSSVAHQSSLSAAREAKWLPSGVDNAALLDWQTPLNGIISPSERGWSLCKNNWKEPRSILMSSGDRVAHISMGNSCNYCIIHNTLPWSITPKVIKPSNPFTNCFTVLFNNIFCAATNFGCIDSFLCPIPETKKWWVDGFPLVLLLPVCLNSKRLLSTSCNKQGQRSSE